MRLLLSALISLFLIACFGDVETTSSNASDAAPAAAASAQEEMKVMAVLMYADWCGSCKVLDPKIQTVRAAGPIDGVEFVRLDYTAKDADALFAQADELGIGETIRTRFAAEVKTGVLLLVDQESGTIISEVTKSMSEAEISDSLIAASSQS